VIRAVIGANYGDEGKGHVVNALAGPKTLVVRFNGGAQAGHTVYYGEHQKHEFHHIGSGAFQGATTLLSHHFIVNPMVLNHELRSLPITPAIYIDRQARITTPWDIWFNRELERKRGDDRHGSCGLGIHETIVRCGQSPALDVGMCRRYRDRHIREWLETLVKVWVPIRAEELGVDPPEPERSASWITNFLQELADANSYWMPCHEEDILVRHADGIIFEGAQGLGLDELAGEFPYVTHSSTGLTNIVELLEAAGNSLRLHEIIYVTRTYITRHGAGPLAHEETPAFCLRDETNQPNEFQGKLRTAPMNDHHATFVRARTEHDRDVNQAWRTNACLAVTCLDQRPLGVFTIESFEERVHLPVGYTSYGPRSAQLTRRTRAIHSGTRGA